MKMLTKVAPKNVAIICVKIVMGDNSPQTFKVLIKQEFSCLELKAEPFG